jgi:hypothetical protein
MNNLLERLHASFFFYIMTGPQRFLKIGFYLPSAILISVAMMFHGLSTWVDAGWVQEHTDHAASERKKTTDSQSLTWKRRRRPVISVLCIMIATHLLGIILFFVVSSTWFMENHKALILSLYISPESVLTCLQDSFAHGFHCVCIHTTFGFANPPNLEPRNCSNFFGLESFKSLFCINCHLDHYSPQLFAGGVSDCAHWNTSRFFLTPSITPLAADEIRRLHQSGARLAALLPGGNGAGCMELGGSYGVVCTVHMHCLSPVGSPSLSYVPLATIISAFLQEKG